MEQLLIIDGTEESLKGVLEEEQLILLDFYTDGCGRWNDGTRAERTFPGR